MTNLSSNFISYLFALFLITSSVQGLSFGDFNGDGKEDFLAQLDDFDQPLTLFLSEEEQLFSEEELQFDLITTDPDLNLMISRTRLTIGDFNGDGHSDILKQVKGAASASILLSDGLGGFTEYTVPEDVDLKYEYNFLHVGDFNGDGRDDIMRKSFDTSNTADSLVDDKLDILLAVDDQSKFFEVVEFLPYTPLSDPYAADFDGDGLDDILIKEDDNFNIYLSNGDGTFEQIDLSSYNLDSSTLTGDFNGDGRADIVSWQGADQSYSLYLSNGDGTFEEVKGLDIDQIAYWGGWALVGDWNGDGKDDLFVRTLNEPENGGVVSFSNGNGFDRISKLTTDMMHSVYAHDFNGDGKTDVFEATTVPDEVLIVHISNGDGTFRRHVIRI